MGIDEDDLKHRLADIVSEEVAEFVSRVVVDSVRSDAKIVENLDGLGAMMKAGRHIYHVNLFKLCTAAAGIVGAALTPKVPSYLVGLAVTAALSGLNGAIRKLSIDEAAVIQSLFSQSQGSSRTPKMTHKELESEVAKLTESKEKIESRVEQAVKSLSESSTVELDLKDKSVTLCEYVFAGRK